MSWLKTKHKQRQKNIHECSEALEDGDALQNTRRWSITVDHEAQTLE